MTHLSVPITHSADLQKTSGQSALARWVGPIASVVAPVALGLALQVNYGQYDPAALGWLTVALLACIIAFRHIAADNTTGSSAMPVSAFSSILGIGLAIQFGSLLTTSPMATLVVHSARDLLWFRVGVFGAAACVGLTIMPSTGPRRQRAAMIGILSTYFLLGLWVLRVAPPPPVDVCVFQRDACHALLHGHNPYAITFPVPTDNPARIYAPGTFAGGRLLFGYPYPPMSLLLILPGYLLGDFRLSHLAAMTLAGTLIALSRPGRIATLAAALLLFTPRGFFVLEAGWTEPLAILMLSAVVFTSRRWPRLSPLALGLFLVTKQYLVFALPLAWACKKLRTRWRMTIVSAVLVSLSLVVWNIAAFLNSAVLLQFHQPMRMDALSYAPWLILHGIRLPAWIPFWITAVAIVMVTRRSSRSPAAFSAGVALVFFIFFAVNKQAFCNYYLFVIAAMCCAVAAGTDVRGAVE